MNKSIIFSLIFVLIIIGFSLYSTRCFGESCGAEANVISSDNFRKQMNNEEVVDKAIKKEIVLIDVREDYEWDGGHIEESINIPLGSIDESLLAQISKNEEVYVYCRSGARASNAKNILEDMGFEKVTNLGGVIDWEASGGKLVR
jgi:rhodanese-related sulfurtransferase